MEYLVILVIVLVILLLLVLFAKDNRGDSSKRK